MEYGIHILAGIGMLFAIVTDICQKMIAIYVILGITVLLSVLQYFNGNRFIWIISLGSGVFFYMVSLLTREKMGKGDAFLFGMTGAAMGLWKNIMIIYISFMIAFFVALFLIIIRKKSKDTAFPFAPCIGLAYFLVLVQ